MYLLWCLTESATELTPTVNEKSHGIVLCIWQGLSGGINRHSLEIMGFTVPHHLHPRSLRRPRSNMNDILALVLLGHKPTRKTVSTYGP